MLELCNFFIKNFLRIYGDSEVSCVNKPTTDLLCSIRLRNYIHKYNNIRK